MGIRKALAALGFGAMICTGSVIAITPVDVQAASSNPNIIIVYMDDFSPKAPQLWSDTERTPALAKFVNQGLVLDANGSTPLCGPARGNLLTGRYGHNSGITFNDIRSYNPRTAIGKKMQSRGYSTALIGKHINKLADRYPTRLSMLRACLGWSICDVIWHNQGRYYNWRQYTRSGTRNYGFGAKDHSSYVAAKSAVRHIKSTPKNTPVFQIVSLYDGHGPNEPMKRFRNHWRCQNIPAWKGPAFNEADVTDKPLYLRNTSKLGRKSYSLQRRCEEIMTVDYVVARIRKALKDTGRLNNTLLIFTADNGWSMGDHRLIGKTYPYTTPVPLYMLWPAKWNNQKRVISEPVSNVDFARTFCAIAGCRMPNSDGKNLLPLLNSRVDYLNRNFIYEEMLHPGSKYNWWGIGRPGWYGIRTTLKYSDTLWVYTEYQKGNRIKGDRELYNLSEDPHQLDNLAGLPEYASIQTELRQILRKKVILPDNVSFKRKLEGSKPSIY